MLWLILLALYRRHSPMVANAPKPRSVTPSTPQGWIMLAVSALYLSYHAVAAWLTVILGRLLFGTHPLSHPDWPIDLAVIAAGFRVCMAMGCLVDFRPLLSIVSCLQFYPGLDIRKVDAGGSKAYCMSLKQGRAWEAIQVVLFYVHGGAFVGGDACMCGLTFQNWMKQLAARRIRAKVLAVEYPLAPEFAFPAALLDTAAAYTWLCEQVKGSNTCIIPVADSAGANILVAALAALRDLDTAKWQQGKANVSAAALAAQTVAATAQGPVAGADVDDIQRLVADMFHTLDARLTSTRNSSSSSNRAPSSRSSSRSNGIFASFSVARDERDLSPAGSSSLASDLTVQIGTSQGPIMENDSSTAAAAAPGSGDWCFTPPPAVVLVSPAMDVSGSACFHDVEWISTHEPRFDYLPSEVVGGGMSHYVTDSCLLPTGYVSPMYLDSLEGLVDNMWMILSGGAELMGRDIAKFATRLSEQLGSHAVYFHSEPHMPHSWAIIPTPSLWPRQQCIVSFIAEQAAAALAAKAKAKLAYRCC